MIISQMKAWQNDDLIILSAARKTLFSSRFIHNQGPLIWHADVHVSVKHKQPETLTAITSTPASHFHSSVPVPQCGKINKEQETVTGGHFRQDVERPHYSSRSRTHCTCCVASAASSFVCLFALQSVCLPAGERQIWTGGNLWKMDLKPIHKALDAANDRINKLIKVHKGGIWTSGLNCFNRQCLP